MEAINEFILIKPEIPAPVEDALGLIETEAKVADGRYQIGIVRLSDPLINITEGTRVVYDSSRGDDIRINDENLKIIQRRDVALIL